jgi:hypothetical protein
MRTIGTPSTQARKLNAIASGALPNGDPVIVNADGTVSVVAASGGDPEVGSPTVFVNGVIGTTGATFDSNSNKVILAYQDGSNSYYGTAIVGTISGSSISFGSPTVFASAGVSYFDEAVTFDSSSNKVVIAYSNPSDNNRGYAIVGTVSGTGISFGTAVRFETGVTTWIGVTLDSSANKVVIVFRDDSDSNYGKAIVGTVSGTSISFGVAQTFSATTSTYNTATFDSNSNKVVIAYQRISAGNCIVGTVSGTSISFGTTVQFDVGTSTDMKPVFDSVSNRVVVAYRQSSVGKAIVGTVSGTAISFGVAQTFSATASQVAPAFDSTNNKVVIAYQDSGNSNYGTAVLGTVSGTSISFGTPVVFEPAATSQTAATFDSSSNKVAIAYTDGGNSNFGTAVVFSTDGTNLTAENYIGLASNGYPDTATATIDVQGAINDRQSGLTAGQSYYVQTDGTLGTTPADPSVFAGTAISATKMIVKG